ncbi:hypothetical protein M758_UG338700 [Ceratodon purpureus]|nr:hypothetical protein M758_UG338700 [Ceratodon purpureus]
MQHTHDWETITGYVEEHQMDSLHADSNQKEFPEPTNTEEGEYILPQDREEVTAPIQLPSRMWEKDRSHESSEGRRSKACTATKAGKGMRDVELDSQEVVIPNDVEFRSPSFSLSNDGRVAKKLKRGTHVEIKDKGNSSVMGNSYDEDDVDVSLSERPLLGTVTPFSSDGSMIFTNGSKSMSSDTVFEEFEKKKEHQ